MPNDVRITVRVSKELANKLTRDAKAYGTSRSEHVAYLIEDAVDSGQSAFYRMDDIEGEVRQLRTDLARAVAVLLVSGGKTSETEAKTWVRDYLGHNNSTTKAAA